MKVVIIGAGVAGLATGLRLAQAGCAVTALDRGQPARGATWAAAGMLAVTAEMECAPEAERALAASANSMWPDFAAELELSSGRPVGYRRDGALLLAWDAAELGAMRARGGFLEPQQIAALIPMASPQLGGSWAPNEAHLDNRALGSALAAAFVRAGGVLVPNEAVVRIEHHEGRAVAVLTPYGRYGADVFLLTAGAWSGLLADIPVTPVKGEMIALTPPAGAALPGPVIWGAGVYLVPLNGRLLVGATVESVGFDTRPTAAARTHLHGRAGRIIPSLAGWSVAEHWAGLRPKSPDGLPLLGPTQLSNLFVAGGQFRNGILFAPAIARMMSDMILGQGHPVPAFDPRRFLQGTA